MRLRQQTNKHLIAAKSRNWSIFNNPALISNNPGLFQNKAALLLSRGILLNEGHTAGHDTAFREKHTSWQNSGLQTKNRTIVCISENLIVPLTLSKVLRHGNIRKYNFFSIFLHFS